MSENEPSAAEQAAAEAMQQAEESPPPKEEAPPMAAPKAEPQGDSGVVPEEKHLIADLAAASVRMFGCQPEVVYGAAHLAGVDENSEMTEAEMAGHIQTFLASPA